MRGLQFALLIVLVPISLQNNERVAGSYAGSIGLDQITPYFLGLKMRQRNGILNVKSQIQSAKGTAFVNPLSKFANTVSGPTYDAGVKTRFEFYSAVSLNDGIDFVRCALSAQYLSFHFFFFHQQTRRFLNQLLSTREANVVVEPRL